jgi:putative ABC transport system permease protein
MLIAGEAMSLSSLKAVDGNYPLKGDMTISRGDDLEIQVPSGPEPGKVWLTPRLLPLLNLKIGDQVMIGEASFVVDAEIRREPDSAQSAFGVAPRAMIHSDDIASTGAVQHGSRVEYHLLLAGAESHIEHIQAQLDSELGTHYRWISPSQSNASLGAVMDRAKRFLLLAGSLNVVLAAIAIALSARQFAESQNNQVALLKTLGLHHRQISMLYLFVFSVLALTAFAVGTMIGWALHHLLLVLLKSVLPQTLATAGKVPFLYGGATVLIALFAFAAPPIWRLKAIEPSAILRQSQRTNKPDWLHYFAACLASCALLWLYSQDIKLSLMINAGLIICGAIGVLFSRSILNVAQQVTRHSGSLVRIALTNLQRQRTLTALQIFVFSSIAMLIVILVQTRTNIVDEWKPQYENAPNHFIFNIFDDELGAIKTLFNDSEIRTTEFYPMTRGRLTHIGQQTIAERLVAEDSTGRYERELNLTWSRELGKDNQIIDGKWWDEIDPSAYPQNTLLVSAEADYAEGLGLKLGERVRFSISGREVNAVLASIRSVQWDSMNPNFFMIFNEAISDTWAANWITSFYLEKNQKPFVNQLVSEFPTVTLIELDQTLELINSVATRASMAIEFILILVLVAALLVMVTSIQASLEERRRESALLRSFGASRSFVQRILLFEFGFIGLLSGLLACIGAELSLYYLTNSILNMPYHFQWQIWVITPIVSTSLIACIGYLATLEVTHTAPLQILKQRD